MFPRIRAVVALAVTTTLCTTMTIGLAPVASADTGSPTSVAVQSQGLNAEVSWAADPAGDVTGYQITTAPESAGLTVAAGARSAVLTGIRPNISYQVSVAAIRGDQSDAPVQADTEVEVAAPGGSFTGLSPARLLDTRDGTGAPVGPTHQVSLEVAGQQGVPGNDVSAVAMNVTVTAPQGPGFVTAYPSGASRPLASNLNYAKGQTVANLVIVPVGPDGRVQLYSSASTHLVADIAGYFSTSETASPISGLFSPVQPARLMDTRSGLGASTPGPGEQVKVQVTGQGGVPATNVSAVVLNTTIAGSTAAAGYVTAYPTGNTPPLASTVNFAKGQIVANRAIVPVGADGSISFLNSAGRTPIVVDVTGWFTGSDDDSASGSYFVPLVPTRLVDTRTGLGAPKARLKAASLLNVGVAGQHTVPAATAAMPAIAPVTTVTLVHPSKATYATAFPGLTQQPLASDLNAVPGFDVPNLALPGLGADGTMAVYNNAGTTDLVVDLSGYFIGKVHVPSSTIVLTGGKVTNVSGDPAGSATVTLAAGAAEVTVGDTINANISPATPNGLLVQVLGVTTNDQGQQIVQTGPGNLADAIGSADLSITVPMDGADAVPMAAGRLAPARVLTPADVERRLALSPQATPVKAPKTKASCSADASSYVEASFSMAPTLHLEAHMGWSGWHPTVNLKSYAEIAEDAYAGFGFTGKASCSWERELASWKFPTVQFTLGPVYVFVIPELTATLKAQISGQATISSSITQHFDAKAGLETDGDSIKPIKTVTNSLTYQPLSLTQANGSASVAVEAVLIGKIYGIGGPTLTVTATLAAPIDLKATPWWQLIFTLSAKAGLALDVWKIHKSVETDDFTLYRKVLAQAGGLPNGTPVDLTFDDYPEFTYITDNYQSYGVVFSGDNVPFTSPDGSNPTSPVLTGGGDNGYGDPLYGVFVNPDGSPRSVSTFTLDVGYIDEPGSTEVLAYSSTGALLATVRAEDEGIDTITITRNDIHSFVVRSTGVEDSGWAIDNVRFQGFAGSIADQAQARRPAVTGSGSTRHH